MKKTIIIFSGIGLLLLSFTMLYFAGVLFNFSNQSSVNSFVFQPNNLSVNRVGKPEPVEKLSEKFIREKLIKKFVTEYFYITPDPERMATRTRSDSILAAMSSDNVFKEWKKNQLRIIEEKTNKKVLRRVIIENEILKKGDFWEVHYELKTWNKSNIMNLEPEIIKDVIYLKIDMSSDDIIREKRNNSRFNIQNYVNQGGDPAAVFKFVVTDLQVQVK